MRGPRFIAALLLLAGAGLAAPAAADCAERERLDEILNVDPAVWVPVRAHDDDPVMHMYDVVGPWAVAVAVGDYAGARALADGILPEMDRLYEAVDGAADPARPESIYHRALVGGMIARIALVDHRFLRALRYGLMARDDARRLAERDPDDPRADFFLGLYNYYTGLAPGWVQAAVALAGIEGDVVRGLDLLEDAARSDQPLAPEAARVLLEETRPAHRDACRYLPLARDLAARYPDNYRFRYYVEREAARCPAGGVDAVYRPPRLGGGCRGPASDPAASTLP